MCGERSKEWVQWISLAEWRYNNNYHTAIKMTPFEVVYGQKPPLYLPYVAHHSMADQVDRSLQARESTIRLLKHHLQLAQCRMKSQVDKKRSPKKLLR